MTTTLTVTLPGIVFAKDFGPPLKGRQAALAATLAEHNETVSTLAAEVAELQAEAGPDYLLWDSAVASLARDQLGARRQDLAVRSLALKREVHAFILAAEVERLALVGQASLDCEKVKKEIHDRLVGIGYAPFRDGYPSADMVVPDMWLRHPLSRAALGRLEMLRDSTLRDAATATKQSIDALENELREARRQAVAGLQV